MTKRRMQEDLERVTHRVVKKANTKKTNWSMNSEDQEMLPAFPDDQEMVPAFPENIDQERASTSSVHAVAQPTTSSSSTSTTTSSTTIASNGELDSDADDDLASDLLGDLLSLKCNLGDVSTEELPPQEMQPSILVPEEPSSTLIVPNPELEVPSRSIRRFTFVVEVERDSGLYADDFPQLQHYAALALTNIAAGTSENTKLLIDHGAVPILVNLLSSRSHDVRNQAVSALGNIAADSPSCRDLVLSHGALIPLLSHLNEQADNLSMLRNATWTLSNFCRGMPQPSFEQVRPALPALGRLLLSNDDEEVLADACWALFCLSAGTIDKIQAVIDAGVCGRLVQLLLHPSPSVLLPALCTVRNIVTGDDMQTQVVINHGSLQCLLSLLTHDHNKSIKQEACRTVSNITAGNIEQIQAVIEAGMIAPLVDLLQNAEFDIQKEAAWALSNATSGGTHEQIKYLGSQGCIKPLCDLLVCCDSRIVAVCLEGLEDFLKVGEAEKNFGNTGDVNLYAQMIDNNEGLEKIKNLQSHDNSEIYEKAVNILKTYWLENESETLPPGNGSQPGFNYGGSDFPATPDRFNFSRM